MLNCESTFQRKAKEQMAHMIESDNMVYAGSRPWHGIGEYLGVSDNADLDMALQKKPILGSTISHTPALASVNGSLVEIPDAFAAIRDYDGKPLGIVGEMFRDTKQPAAQLKSLPKPP